MKRRMLSAVFGCLVLVGCGGEGASLPTPLAEGQPSGIEACDQFLQAACACAEQVPAAKATCDLAKQSKEGWHAASGIASQKAAASQACAEAKMTLEALSCKKP